MQGLYAVYWDNSIELTEEGLLPLEQALRRALETGDESGLVVLGYGEISCVLGCSFLGREYACKRLPPFPSADHFGRYSDQFHQYVQRLRDAGVPVLGSRLFQLPGSDGISAFCVQPRLPKEALLPNWMRSISRADAERLFEKLLAFILGSVKPALGLDGQLSNWILADGEPAYLDVTTPMMRDEKGRECLDTDIFLASLPWLLRGPVRAFLMSSILDKYYEPRGVVLDLIGNLHKEKLDALIGPFLDLANRHFSSRPIQEAEIKRYYEDDARMWAFLQRLRRLDRAWQRKVRGRVYPFLLPGQIDR